MKIIAIALALIAPSLAHAQRAGGGLPAGNYVQASTAGAIVATSSVTASAFFGDGSHLTGLSGTFVPFTGATAGKNVVLGNNNLSTNYGITAATGNFSGNLIASSIGNVANYSNATGSLVTFSNVLPLGYSFRDGTTHDLDMSATGAANFPYGVAAGSFTATSSVTASAFFGDGSNLAGVAPIANPTFTGVLTVPTASIATFTSSVTMTSSVTITGNGINNNDIVFSSNGILAADDRFTYTQAALPNNGQVVFGTSTVGASAISATLLAALTGTILVVEADGTRNNVFTLLGENAADRFVMSNGGASAGTTNLMEFNKSTGTLISPAAVGINTTLAEIRFRAPNQALSMRTLVDINAVTSAVGVGINSIPTFYSIATTKPGAQTSTVDFIITSSGTTCLNRTTEASCNQTDKLDVNGGATIVGQETVTSSITVQGAGNFAVGTLLTIDSATVRGNLGVGTANPATLLHLSSGTLKIDGNTAAFVSSGPVTASSATFVGVEVSTQAAGGAGASVTATCRTAGTFAIGGGCSCSGAVAETANISTPNVVTAGGIATGWTCQVSGGTGGACSAYAICSRLQ